MFFLVYSFNSFIYLLVKPDIKLTETDKLSQIVIRISINILNREAIYKLLLLFVKKIIFSFIALTMNPVSNVQTILPPLLIVII